MIYYEAHMTLGWGWICLSCKEQNFDVTQIHNEKGFLVPDSVCCTKCGRKHKSKSEVLVYNGVQET